VFLSTLDLGGESINLTQAQYIIFLDRSWSPAKMLQAVGRVYRPGQTGAVEVIHINSKSTVDSYVKLKLDTKGKWFDDIFGD
jgi:SNF2 family DNA or RNA helicase